MTTTTVSTPVVAPQAPAAWGQPVTPAAMGDYLDRLASWCTHRRAELAELDTAALHAPDGDATGDVTLAMAMWQTVDSRRVELVRTWADGRVGPVELAALSTAIWGRTQATTATGQVAANAASGVSLPEACRLSDAVTTQLRRRLALVASDGDVLDAVRGVRTSLERARDLVVHGPVRERETTSARLAKLDARLSAATERARRGADIGDVLPGLQQGVATFERDLIVAAARARDDERDHLRAVTWSEALAQTAAAVTDLADRCVAGVHPAPVLGIPNVSALGAVPDDPRDVDAYLARLATVERALEQVRGVYGAPLNEVAELIGLLEASDMQAREQDQHLRAEVEVLSRVGHELAAVLPVDLVRMRGVVNAYRALLHDSNRAPSASATTSGVSAAPVSPPTTSGRSS